MERHQDAADRLLMSAMPCLRIAIIAVCFVLFFAQKKKRRRKKHLIPYSH
jgi:hypothetical protein